MELLFETLESLETAGDGPSKYSRTVLETGLEALFASDVVAPVTGAAVCAAAGFYHDTQSGIAHALEHVRQNDIYIADHQLHTGGKTNTMGSKEIPDLTEYRNFIQSHGGLTHAFTRTDSTTFAIEVRPPYLQQTLRRTAAFLKDLFLRETKQELGVIGQEYKGHLNDNTHQRGRFSRHLSRLDIHTVNFHG